MQVNLFHAVSYHRKQLQFVHQFGKTKKTLFTVFLQYTIQKFEVSNAHQGCIHLIWNAVWTVTLWDISLLLFSILIYLKM